MNEHRASAAVTPMVPVPGWQPGMTPMMELAQMKKNSAARNGKCFFQVFSPTMDFTMSSRTNSTTYSTPFTNRPCGTRLADCFFLNTKSTTSIRMSATASQNVYVVRPTVVLPTMVAPAILRRALANSSAPDAVLPLTRQTMGRVISFSSDIRRSATLPPLSWLWAIRPEGTQ